MPGLAEELDCVLKLGGRRAVTRHSRRAARVTITGTSALDLFYMILRRSKRAQDIDGAVFRAKLATPR
eukprot:7083829-Lingulodinium_polyedra.AAC.1